MTGREPGPSEVMRRLCELAESVEKPKWLIGVEDGSSGKTAVKWETIKGNDPMFKLQSCQKALWNWRKSYQKGS